MDTRVPARMPYWTSQKQSRNVAQRGSKSSPGRGGPAEEWPVLSELGSQLPEPPDKRHLVRGFSHNE